MIQTEENNLVLYFHCVEKFASYGRRIVNNGLYKGLPGFSENEKTPAGGSCLFSQDAVDFLSELRHIW